MARGRFCTRCGNRYPNDEANFCSQCGMHRGECEIGLQGYEQAEQNEELAINATVDLRGPLHIESVSLTPTLKSPSYNSIFNPPPVKNRRTNKVYGKLALRKHWAIQHTNLKDNYKQVKKWIKDGQDNGILPRGTFSLDDVGVRETLNKIIDDNIDGLQELKFKDRNESYKWTKNNIYKNIKKHLKYLRQKERRLQRRTTHEASQVPHDAEVHVAAHQVPVDPLWFLEGETGEHGFQSSQQVNGVESSQPKHAVEVSIQEESVDEDNETFVMKKMGLSDIDDMYSELQTFMIESNVLVKPRPFPNSRRLKEMEWEQRLELVASFFRNRGRDWDTRSQP